MGLWHVVGIALIIIGGVEVVLFRSLAPRQPNIARRMPFLMANSALNVTLGAAALAWAFTH